MTAFNQRAIAEALVHVEDELDHHLKLTVDVLRKSFPPDTHNLCFMIRVVGSMQGELELTYGFAKNSYDYSPEVTGSSVHVALVEFLRRQGHEMNNSSQIIPALLAPPSEDG
jgi:hypothetical protein